MGTIPGKFQYWCHPHNLKQTNHFNITFRIPRSTLLVSKNTHQAYLRVKPTTKVDSGTMTGKKQAALIYHILPNYLSTIIQHQGQINFQINLEPPQNSRRQKGDMKQVENPKMLGTIVQKSAARRTCRPE
jgi:hypothetical protein